MDDSRRPVSDSARADATGRQPPTLPSPAPMISDYIQFQLHRAHNEELWRHAQRAQRATTNSVDALSSYVSDDTHFALAPARHVEGLVKLQTDLRNRTLELSGALRDLHQTLDALKKSVSLLGENLDVWVGTLGNVHLAWTPPEMELTPPDGVASIDLFNAALGQALAPSRADDPNPLNRVQQSSM